MTSLESWNGTEEICILPIDGRSGLERILRVGYAINDSPMRSLNAEFAVYSSAVGVVEKMTICGLLKPKLLGAEDCQRNFLDQSSVRVPEEL